jgi:hypothetical protein
MGDLARLKDGIEFAAVFDHFPGTHKTRRYHEAVATDKFHRLPRFACDHDPSFKEMAKFMLRVAYAPTASRRCPYTRKKLTGGFRIVVPHGQPRLTGEDALRVGHGVLCIDSGAKGNDACRGWHGIPFLTQAECSIVPLYSNRRDFVLDFKCRRFFAKLNLKSQREILVINAPASFEGELAALKNVVVLRDPKKVKTVEFALAFATTQVELDRLATLLAPKALGDALLWFAYPKGTSKRYGCEFNRDSGWNVMVGAGFETVRAVAIGEDWSALRFRRIQFVKRSAAAPASSAPMRRRSARN